MEAHRMKVVSIALTGAMVASLAACTASPAEAGGSIRVAVIYPDVWAEPYEAAAAAYEAANPGTDIEIEVLPYEGAVESLQTSFTGGAAPDVVQLEPPTITDFAGRGFLESLENVLEQPLESGEPLSEVFVDGTLDSIRAQDGIAYALPGSQIHVRVLTRSDALDSAGVDAPATTWDESLDVNQAFRDADVEPLFVGLGGNDGAIWWRFTLMLNAMFRPLTEDINLRANSDDWSYDFTDPQSVAGETYTADEKYVAFINGLTDPARSPEYRRAIELMLQLSPFVQDDLASFTPEEAQARFARGDVAQSYGLASDIAARVAQAEDLGLDFPEILQSDFPTITEDNWDGLTAGGQNPLLAVRFGLGVNAESENKDLAIDFIKFVSEPENATAIYAAGFFREDGSYGIGETSAVKGVEYPEGSNLVASDVELIPELSLFGFGMPPTYDNEDFDQFNTQSFLLWNGDITIDEFLEQRSASNLAALERNLQVFASEVDQQFISENTQ